MEILLGALWLLTIAVYFKLLKRINEECRRNRADSIGYALIGRNGK